MTTIHPTAIIDPTARLADDVRVGPWCRVGPGVELGSGCELLDHVVILDRTIAGARNRFHPFCVVGADPQDRKFHGEATSLEIGDGNEFREHVTLHRGTSNGGSVTRIGSDNLVMVGSHVAHDCHVGDRVVIANQVMLAGHVRIEDDASIGGGVGVHHYATIGRLAFVGGMARISRDVPPYMIVEGHPAEVRAVNVIGLVRNGFTQDEIDGVKDAFRRLFRESGSMADNLPDLRVRHASIPSVMELCDAVEAASVGTHGRAREAARSDDKWASVAAVERGQSPG